MSGLENTSVELSPSAHSQAQRSGTMGWPSDHQSLLPAWYALLSTAACPVASLLGSLAVAPGLVAFDPIINGSARLEPLKPS